MYVGMRLDGDTIDVHGFLLLVDQIMCTKHPRARPGLPMSATEPAYKESPQNMTLLQCNGK